MNGYKVSFALDYVNEYLNEYLEDFSYCGIYSADESFSGEKEDATRFLQYCENKEVHAVIVDDYQFYIEIQLTADFPLLKQYNVMYSSR